MIHNLRWCVFWRSFSMSFTSNILYIFSSTSVVRSWLFFVESVSICCSPFCYFCFLQDTAPSFCILSLLLHVLEDPMACHNAIFLPNDELHLISEVGNSFIVEPARKNRYPTPNAPDQESIEDVFIGGGDIITDGRGWSFVWWWFVQVVLIAPK